MRRYRDKGGRPIHGKSLPPATHSFSTRVIQNLWMAPVGNHVGNLGMSGGLPVEKMGKPAEAPHAAVAVHTGRTPPVHKKGAATWEYDLLPSVHSPYYYYVLITQ
jgi:hypothetical protein